MPPRMKLEDYFPDLPSAPPSGYLFMLQDRKNDIDEKVKEKAEGSTDRAEVFKVRTQVAKTMWNGKLPFILLNL